VDDLPHFQHKEQPADMDNHTAAKAAKTYTARRIRLTISKGSNTSRSIKGTANHPKQAHGNVQPQTQRRHACYKFEQPDNKFHRIHSFKAARKLLAVVNYLL
jgi:hypothetical protein